MVKVKINGNNIHKVQMKLKSKNNWCTSYLSYPEHRIGAEGQNSELILKIPPHLRSMALVTKENFDKLKMESKGTIKLVTAFGRET